MGRLLLSLAALALLAAGCRATADGESLFGPGARVRITGNESFGEPALFAAIASDVETLPDGEDATKARVDDAAWAIESFYRDAGFPFVEVRYEFAPPTTTLTVAEGPRTLLESVDLRPAGPDGALEADARLAFDEDELVPFFLAENGLFGSSIHYVEREVEAAEGELLDYHLRSGYLDARVGPHTVEFSDDETRASIVVPVHAGIRYRLRSVDYRGELVLPRETLDRLADKAIGEAYTPQLGYRVRASVLERYQEAGYPDCAIEIRSERDRASGDVSLVYTVTPGPLVTIAEVRLEGIDRVDPELVRTRFGVRAGDRYDSSEIREGLRQLYASGLFHSVDLSLEDGEGSERSILIRVRELPSLELFVLPGYGSYEGPRVVFGSNHKDFLGTGKRLRAEANLSRLHQGARLNFYDPWLGRRDLYLTSTISADRREEPAFTSIEYGIVASVVRRWSNRLESSIGYRYRLSRLEESDAASPDPDDAEPERIELGSLETSTTFDERDAIFLPTRGTRTRGNLVWASKALGSTVDFLKPELEANAYFGLPAEVTLALAWRSAVAIPIAGTDEIPIQERLFVGGENTVRSFRQDELGPRDASGTPLGGQASNVINFELRRDLVGNVSGALFYDVGAVQKNWEGWGLSETGTGIGGGLRYLLPIGPVRLDAAWNPDPGPDDDEWVVHLSVGMPF